ncbi:MAG: VCBS repeat-containing protein [Leptolyngbyaceae cyanobacterium SM2_5_2]|nr:VCBS repeat-containing protein [Leptolyngbyaceae cyanobacterium SM2_5_2]
MVWRHRTAGTNVVWFLEGNEIADFTTLTPVEAGWNMVGAADFTQDGRLDILWRHGTAGANVIWEMEGLELRDGYVLPAASPEWTPVV